MKTGRNYREGRNLRILGKGEITLGDDVRIGDDVVINVSERLVIGDRSHIGDNFIIEGRDIELGTEFWSGHHCQIGGGSRFDKPSMLRIGYWGHLGDFGFINTARPVTIGDEVGMGVGTKIYTHGAYLSMLDGFPVEYGPVKIGNRVWLPGATVLPNVSIGDDIVVGVGAVVTKDIPSGSLAAGVPARVIRENCYPRTLTPEEKRRTIDAFLEHVNRDITEITATYLKVSDALICLHSGTNFNLSKKQIVGEVDDTTEILRNELRRFGVRFKSYPEDGRYVQWD
jgi:acetyltransferase-like isoleucine patch superfamily enzyme